MKNRPGRPQRLAPELYLGDRACAFTACMWDRTAFFTCAERVDPQIEYLRRSALEFECGVMVYCFMPDHLHVMFRGLS